MDELTDKERRLLNEIALKNGISNSNLEVKPGSSKGENYLSVTKSVTIKDENAEKTLNIFLKRALSSTQLREQVPLHRLFSNEIAFYETTLPKFQAIHYAHKANFIFPKFPKFYGKIEDEAQECIMLEDLKTQGFKLWNRTEVMDSNHIKLVFQECGKIHAFSFLLKDQLPEEFSIIYKLHDNVFPEMTHNQIKEKLFDNIIQLLDNPEFTPVLQKAKENSEKFFCEVDKEKLALVHADCWSGNVLFNYQDEKNPNIPTEVCMIDWQRTTVGTPIIDLAHFFLETASREILDDYESYLSVYYQSLSRMLLELGCEPDKVFPYSELQRNWKKYCKYGLYLWVFFANSTLCNSSEILDIQDIVEAGSSFMDVFNVQTVNHQIVKKRVSDVVSFMIKNDLI